MRKNMDDLLKQRMGATQQASELQISDAAYTQLLQKPLPASGSQFCDLPLDKLVPFRSGKLAFHPYPPERLCALSQELCQAGLLERIIVREIPGTDLYEILAGHNRTNAARLAQWKTIPAEVVAADDDRAWVIAISTNLLRRQGLTIIERGFAYKELLAAKNRNGQHDPWGQDKPFGENRQRYNAREVVASFFGVSEYEIRKAIKLTNLITPLAELVEGNSKHLNLACAELIADYDKASQEAFVEICSVEGYYLNKATTQAIIRACPPPTADRQSIFAAWRSVQARADRRTIEAPRKLSFDRKRFAPYLTQFRSDGEIAELFLEFLKQRCT